MSTKGTGHGRLWSFVTGERGVNRVRVYERSTGGPIWIEWFDRNGRHQETLTNLAGMPIRDKDLAKKIAERSALKQREKREAQALHALFGVKADHTLGELVAKYHAAKQSGWAAGHRRGQESAKKFWLRVLGEGRVLKEVTPALVREKVREEGERRQGEQWSARTRGRMQAYIKELFTFAYKELRWIEQDHQLDAVKIETTDGESKPYSLEETRRILKAAPKVDVRIGAICVIAAISGRRANAIVTLPKDAYSRVTVGDRTYGVLQFPAHTDKARKAGRVLLGTHARIQVEELLNQPLLRKSQWLFPFGKLDAHEEPTRHVGVRWLTNYWRKVEDAAEVKHQRGRMLHGVKRRWATDALPIDPLAASKQSGTRVDMLAHRYAQDEDAPKASLADQLEEVLA